MSDELEKRGGAEEREKRGGAEERERLSDVEAHRLNDKIGESDEKREDDGGADVEGHMLGDKFSAGKNQP